MRIKARQSAGSTRASTTLVHGPGFKLIHVLRSAATIYHNNLDLIRVRGGVGERGGFP